jgi:hypothetical protein
MNIAMVFLVFWVNGATMPTAKFIRSFPDMDSCTKAKEIGKRDPDLKDGLACIQILGTLPDAGEPF